MVWQPGQAGGGRDVHDRSSAGVSHRTDDGLDPPECADEVDVEGALERVDRLMLNRRGPMDPRIVHEHRQRAEAHRELHSCSPVVIRRDVEADGMRRRAEHRGGGGQLVLEHVTHDDGGAFGDQQLGFGRALPTRGTGDDGNLSLQFHVDSRAAMNSAPGPDRKYGITCSPMLRTVSIMADCGTVPIWLRNKISSAPASIRRVT